MSTADNEMAAAAQGTYFGYTASQWWGIANGAGEGALQGGANAVYGLQQGVVGMLNFGLIVSDISPIAGVLGWNLKIPDYDWSNGLVTTETASAHNLSVFLGGQGLTELITFGAGALAESCVVCKLTSWGCFSGSTEVITGENANGTFSETPIQDIQVGDYVLSRNQYDPNGPLQEEQVTAVEQHTEYTLQNVTVEGADGTTEVIQSTPNHPYYVEGEGWTYAGDLVAGDELEMPDGSYATAVSSTSVADPTGVTVYNFTVNNDHTYFVDQGGAVVWVHNICENEVFDSYAKFKYASRNFVGDERAGHEVLQFNWLDDNGFGIPRGGTNPVIALSDDVHKAVNAAQRAAGIYGDLSGTSAMENILKMRRSCSKTAFRKQTLTLSLANV